MSFVQAPTGLAVALPSIGFALDHVMWMTQAASSNIVEVNSHPVKNVAKYYYGENNPDQPSLFKQLCAELRPCLGKALLSRAHTMCKGDVSQYEDTLTKLELTVAHRIISNDAADIAIIAAAALRPELFPAEKTALKRLANDMKTLTCFISTKPEERAKPDYYLNGPTVDALRALCATVDPILLQSVQDAKILWKFSTEAQMLLHARLSHVLENQRDNGVRDSLFGINAEIIESAHRAGIISDTFYAGAMVMLEHNE